MDVVMQASMLRNIFSTESVHVIDNIHPIIPGSSYAASMLSALGEDILFSAADRLIMGRLSEVAREPLVALLQQALRQAIVDVSSETVGRLVKLLNFFHPDEIQFRLEALSTLSAAGEYNVIVDLFWAFQTQLLEGLPSLNYQLSLILIAAFKAERFDFLQSYDRKTGPEYLGSAEVRSLQQRVAALEAADLMRSISDCSSRLEIALKNSILSLDEYQMLQHLLEASVCPEPHFTATCLRMALGCAGLARQETWARPYRIALELSAKLLASTGAVDQARDQWLKSALPVIGFEPFLLQAGTFIGWWPLHAGIIRQQTESMAAYDRAQLLHGEGGEPAFRDALIAFYASPSVSTARKVWSLSYITARFSDLTRSAPVKLEIGDVERARSIQTVELTDGLQAPLWVMMTWRTGADRLLQTLSAYLGKATVVVSVGGDAEPPGLARASAALFFKDVHLLARPVVAWGGQKGMFYNLIEVLEAFRNRSSLDSWMQIVCDRSYPIKSLQKLKNITANGQLIATGTGPSAWRHEFSDKQVAILPDIYNAALEETFSRCRPEMLIDLETRSPLFGDGDFRINTNIFNFSNKALLNDWDMRSGWHKYFISPYETDVRWMSYARLQEYVDVSSESMSTFVRRLFPPVMRWVHSVLLKYDFRIGDPWVYFSRKYIDRVLTDPGFDELFAAMNLGFAPEMNFFDTVAATHNLLDDFIHHYHSNDSEMATDDHLSKTCHGADCNARSFVRKTDLVSGRNLISFFAQRILEDDLAKGFHWVVADGNYAPDDQEPRPQIDNVILERFLGTHVIIRDMLSRSCFEAIFQIDTIVAVDDNRIIATWLLNGSILEVSYNEPISCVKRYGRVGGDERFMTLPPLELVSPHNAWSLFLDFDLNQLITEWDVPRLGSGKLLAALSKNLTWIGAGSVEAALLNAFADNEKSDFPTPTLTAKGGVYEIRDVDGVPVALCSLDGFPALLQITGSAQVRDRCAVHLKQATYEQSERWDTSSYGAPEEFLERSAIPGSWTFELLGDKFNVELTEDGWLVDHENTRLGRWFLRPEGMQILGMKVLRLGIADHLRQIEGRWRLSGWGWRSLKDAVTFSMMQDIAL